MRDKILGKHSEDQRGWIMKDIQNNKDNRNIDIDQVGVKRIRYPITVRDKDMGKQQTVAEIITKLTKEAEALLQCWQ